jgi:hypothetical protein
VVAVEMAVVEDVMTALGSPQAEVEVGLEVLFAVEPTPAEVVGIGRFVVLSLVRCAVGEPVLAVHSLEFYSRFCIDCHMSVVPVLRLLSLELSPLGRED